MTPTRTLSKLMGIAVVIALSPQVLASNEDYMIPKGQYLSEDLMLKVSKVKRTVTTNEQGEKILSVRYRLPAVIEGENAKTIQLTGVHIPNGESALISKEGHTAICSENDESRQKCEIDYYKNKELSPNISIFEIDRAAGEEFVNTQPFTRQQAHIFSLARTSLEHEARGVIFFETEY